VKAKIFKVKTGSLILCVTLFFLLFFGPILNKLAVILLLLLGLGSRIIEKKKMKRCLFHFFICILGPSLALIIAYCIGLLQATDRSASTSITLHIGIVSFLVVYATDSVSELMATHETNFSEVLGALNTYLIFGFIYGEIYALIAYFQDGSFSIAKAIAKLPLSSNPMHDSWIYIYFSFITQTSLGFGDITPVTHLAQVVVISQSIFGQFYIAIVLAYLLHNYNVNDART
jgi:hypothetical protein